MRQNTTFIAWGGISAAAAFILVLAASFLPTLKLAFMFCAGLCPLVLLYKHKALYAVCCHAAAGVLIMLLIPNVVYGLAYLFMFGLYPFVRAWARKAKKRSTELAALGIFSFLIILSAYFAGLWFFGLPQMLPAWLAVLLAVPVSAAVVFIEDILCGLFTNLLIKLKI